MQLNPSGAIARVAAVYTDHRGAPVAEQNHKAGQLAWQLRYAPFGATAQVGAAAVASRLRLPGQNQTRTGVYDNYLRDFDPISGRYLQPDPVGLAGGVNRYAYADGDPINRIDPRGTYAFFLDPAVRVLAPLLIGAAATLIAQERAGEAGATATTTSGEADTDRRGKHIVFGRAPHYVDTALMLKLQGYDAHIFTAFYPEGLCDIKMFCRAGILQACERADHVHFELRDLNGYRGAGDPEGLNKLAGSYIKGGQRGSNLDPDGFNWDGHRRPPTFQVGVSDQEFRAVMDWAAATARTRGVPLREVLTLRDGARPDVGAQEWADRWADAVFQP